MAQEDSKSPPQKLGGLHIISSVLAAAIGVQNRKNQEKDFNGKNSVYIYIAAGLIFTTIFVLSIYAVVSMVLSQAGA